MATEHRPKEAFEASDFTIEAIEQLIRAFLHDERVTNQGGGCCHLMSEIVECMFDAERREGLYAATDGRPICAAHFWNVLADGSILDLTADQFGEGRAWRLAAPGDPEHARYVDREGMTETEYDAADEDAGRRAAELGHGWWLADVRPYVAYLRMQVDRYRCETAACRLAEITAMDRSPP